MATVEKRIEERGLKKSWVMVQLKISRGTFYSRLKNKDWKPEEVTVLKRLGLQ